ncbi:MAG: cell wall hydrolase [Hyphomicrobiales bacterium]|nr:cell wall hydrolase [Hyphomicrobiales bacterium]MCP4997515.1 cell wall hydrolase [Hyphomicrobiales bacterium]
MSGANNSESRWQSYLEDAPAGSIHAAEMVFTDSIITGTTVSDTSMKTPDGRTIAFRTKKGARIVIPDEERVTRGQKRGRITTTIPVAPPKNFSAGSILERQSMLKNPTDAENVQMVFVDPAIRGQEVQIATAFHPKLDEAEVNRVPVMLASLVTNDKPDVLANAYAPGQPDYAKNSPFASVLKDDNEGRFLPPIPKNDHAWAGHALPPHVFKSSEQQCLASGVYFEARGEPVKGQAAVAQVILNRVRNPAYPNTICGVVYQNKRWRNRCQFSFACDGVRDRVRSRPHWSVAKDIAMAVTAGKIWLKEVGSSTHYHATYVRPKWARTMKRVGRIGLHIFYRTRGGGWS